MALGVLFNLPALQTANLVDRNSSRLQKTLRELSSGSRINSAADDAAGLSLANGMNANVAALAQSVTNIASDSSLLKVADGALSQVTSLLNRAVSLASESANGILNGAQRTAANDEYQSILDEITNIGNTTTYNQKAVFGSKVDAYMGDSTLIGSMIDEMNITALSSSHLGDSGGSLTLTAPTSTTAGKITYTAGTAADLSNTSLLNASDAQSTLVSLNAAISAVSMQDGYLGAQINLMDSVGAVLATQEENTLSALNAVQSVDYATATSNLASEQVLMQTSIAALAQATQSSQDVLKLIQ